MDSKKLTNTTLDALDTKLIMLLQKEPRISNRNMSIALGVSEPTIASRIGKLEKLKHIRVIASVDMKAAGFQYWVLFGMRVWNRRPQDLAQEIITIPGVIALTSTVGRYELVGCLLARDLEDLNRILNNDIGNVSGIADIETNLVINSHLMKLTHGTLDVLGSNKLPQPVDKKGVLDQLDWDIITELQIDGRKSFRKISRGLNVPEATVRSRINRLVQSDLVRIKAISALNMDGNGTDTDVIYSGWIGIRVRGNALEDILNILSKLDNTQFLVTTLGRFNVMVGVFADNRRELLNISFETISPLSGVEHVETLEVVDSFKHDMRIFIPSGYSRNSNF